MKPPLSRFILPAPGFTDTRYENRRRATVRRRWILLGMAVVSVAAWAFWWAATTLPEILGGFAGTFILTLITAAYARHVR